MNVIPVICTLIVPHYHDPLTPNVSSPANQAGVMSHKSCQIWERSDIEKQTNAKDI